MLGILPAILARSLSPTTASWHRSCPGTASLPYCINSQQNVLHCAYTVRFRVEWDENKNLANLAKHGIDFSWLAPVFEDSLSLTVPDRVAGGEWRYRTIGAALNGVVLVAHTLREVSEGEELVRVISARYATSSERKAYEEGEY